MFAEACCQQTALCKQSLQHFSHIRCCKYHDVLSSTSKIVSESRKEFLQAYGLPTMTIGNNRSARGSESMLRG